MVQFYFLSVFLTIAGGYALSFAERSSRHHLLRNLDAIFMDARVRLALGILNLVTGAFKLISPMRGDVRIIGDLFPALAGLLVGAVLLLELRRSSEVPLVPEGGSPEGSETPSDRLPEQLLIQAAAKPLRKRQRLEAFLLKSGAAIGFAAIFIGIVHFLFPMELFL